MKPVNSPNALLPKINQEPVKKHFKLNYLSLAIAVAIHPLAFAQTEINEKNHSEIAMIQVVGQATSGLDSVITQEDLDSVQANDLSDIFRGDSSVSAGGSVKMGQKVYLRNLGEDILNISIDGAEQASGVFHHSGRLAIEPELLKRVEVEAGAGSATAGPGALGGSVKFTTKDPEDLLSPGKNAGGMLKSTYFENGEGFKNTATVFGRNGSDTLSAILTLTRSDLDNLDDGNGDEIVGTESEQELGYVKLVANITDEQYLSISYEDLTEEGDILYRPELIASARNVAEPTEGNRQTTILNYGFTSENNQLIDISLNAYHTDQEQEREFRGTAYDGAVKSVGFTLQNTSRFSGNELIYGINYRDDESSLNDVDFAPNSYFEETGEVKGIYVQDIIQLGQHWTVSTGVRFDEYELEDANGVSFNDDGISPNISTNYQINPQWGISVGYAEAFRGVEIQDSFRLSTSSNSTDLDAEKAKNAELGLDYKMSNFSAALILYKSVIDDPITRTPPWSSVVTNLEDDIETVGYTINFEYQLDRLSLAASFNSADSEVDGVPVTRYVYSSSAASIGDTLVFDVDYQLNESVTTGWSAEFVKGIDDINQNVGGDDLSVDKPGYAVHDFYVRWLPMKDDQLTISLSVNNVFDKQYLSHASVEDYRENAGYSSISGSPEAGRDVRLSAALRF